MTTKSDSFILSNGMKFMHVPAGEFLMGSKDDNKFASLDEKPQHTVDIPYDYWIARFPITNQLFNDYVQSKNLRHPVKNWEMKKDHPVVLVSWDDIREYCKWLNNLFKTELPPRLILRLPSEAEWEKASRGTDGHEYPWGNTFDETKCNFFEGGKHATTPVGSYSPQGDSICGCADMAGNVWEWTGSLKKSYPYKSKDGRESEQSKYERALRGGSYDSNQWQMRCAARNSIDSNEDRGTALGFRIVACAWSPISL